MKDTGKYSDFMLLPCFMLMESLLLSNWKVLPNLTPCDNGNISITFPLWFGGGFHGKDHLLHLQRTLLPLL